MMLFFEDFTKIHVKHFISPKTFFEKEYGERFSSTAAEAREEEKV